MFSVTFDYIGMQGGPISSYKALIQNNGLAGPWIN